MCQNQIHRCATSPHPRQIRFPKFRTNTRHTRSFGINCYHVSLSSPFLYTRFLLSNLPINGKFVPQIAGICLRSRNGINIGHVAVIILLPPFLDSDVESAAKRRARMYSCVKRMMMDEDVYNSYEFKQQPLETTGWLSRRISRDYVFERVCSLWFYFSRFFSPLNDYLYIYISLSR